MSDRFLLSADSFVVEGQNVTAPILVVPFNPLTSAFGMPINTFPGIPVYPANAHTSSFARDDFTGSPYSRQHLPAVHALGWFGREPGDARCAPPTVEQTWSNPISVTGPGTFDFFNAVVDARVT